MAKLRFCIKEHYDKYILAKTVIEAGIIINNEKTYYKKDDYKTPYDIQQYYFLIKKNFQNVFYLKIYDKHDAIKEFVYYLKNSKVHNLDGAAVICNNSFLYYFIDGKLLPENEWKTHPLVIARKRKLKLETLLIN